MFGKGYELEKLKDLVADTVEPLFKDDAAGGGGGGMIIQNGAVVTIEKSTVDENTGKARAGGVYVYMATMHMKDSTINDNFCAGSGAAVAVPLPM